MSNLGFQTQKQCSVLTGSLLYGELPFGSSWRSLLCSLDIFHKTQQPRAISHSTSTSSRSAMAFTQQTVWFELWGYHQPQLAINGYAMMSHPSHVQHQSSPAMSGPMDILPGPVDIFTIYHPYPSGPPSYTRSAPGCDWPTHSNMAHANCNMPFQNSAYWEWPVVPMGILEHEKHRSTNHCDGEFGRDGRQHSPSISAKPGKGDFKTPDPLNTDFTFKKPTGADDVNFSTPIDTLMKAIQRRPEVVDAHKAKESICDVDGKAIHRSTYRNTHKRVHTGQKRCSWPGCGLGFSQSSNLKIHMRRHTGDKPFRCEQCQKSFVQRGNLKAHMTKHTGKKPFVCKLDQCDKKFTLRGNLKNHQNKYHEKTVRELTDWVISIPDMNGLTNAQRKTIIYFKDLHKNSNKGIKGRGKGRRVAMRIPRARRTSSQQSNEHFTSSVSLAVHSLERASSTEQQQQRHHPQGCLDVRDREMALPSTEGSDGHNVAFASLDGMY
ncbi:hypothetical protein CABS02_13373 [Colletotrichum abscissum]|uniref:C2H2-type domain-containing protein n=1 Tax=Colletotrichum abscissum TaxID=1671311 RepID=A0A9Q0AX14_9PEZI|nr:hypothetical protein CABS02_13373 [Colletotrichum abscissum]